MKKHNALTYLIVSILIVITLIILALNIILVYRLTKNMGGTEIKDIYSDIIIYALVYIVLFCICIVAVAILINKMIGWQKTTNENLRRAAEVATAADNAKTRFLAQMSHEIRTPINTILGMNEMILNENSDREIEQYSVNIKSAGNTLLSLINDILDFSKIESERMEIVPVKYDVASMINDIVNMVGERAAQKGLDFELKVDENIPSTLFGDDVRLRQIILNLLVNAVKYTEKGFVIFDIKADEVTNDSVLLEVSVTDSGIGIKEEEIPKLFDSFQRLDEQRNHDIEGTGLGIPITYNLLKMMGSELKVSSIYGKGSTFSFSVKQGVVSLATIGNYSERLKESLNSNDTSRYVYAPDADILVVDDNEMNLRVAEGLMKRSGFVPDKALSGKECIEKASKKHYDIIFMDHMMPGMDGVETLRILRDGKITDGTTFIIAMTANAINGAKEAYLKEGFDDYLSKPIIIERLENTLAKYLPKEKVSFRVKERKPLTDKPSETAAVPDKPSEKISLDSSFPFLDVKAGLTYCADDEDFYLEMLDTYIENPKANDLEDFYAAKDWANYRIVAHSLKSTSLSIGASALSERARALEFAAKDGDIEYIDKYHSGLIADYKQLLSDIRLAMKKSTMKEENSQSERKAYILVVDDDNMNLKIAEKLLAPYYEVKCVSSGKKALECLETSRPDLILLDLHMPEMDGFEVLNLIRSNEETNDIPVIILTADDDGAAEIKGLEEGATDFYRKPFVGEIMLKRVERILELSHLQHNMQDEIKRQTQIAEDRLEKVERLSKETVLSLAKAVDAKDKYTNGHSERVAKYSREIAKRAGMSDARQQDIYFMGLLHDIGKIGIPDSVINKPEKLSDEEFALIKKHPVMGYEILKNITDLPGIGQGARWHHERYDGGGYPDGLKGNQLPECARIICVADAYDAMTSKRSYRDVLPQAVVRAEVEKCKGKQFDPKFADIMLEMIDEDKDYQMREF